MSNLSGALQELRAERSRAQSHLEKLDQAIEVIQSLNGSAPSANGNHPTRVISAASRRKMAAAQKARWAKAKNGSQPAATTPKTNPSPAKHTMSAASRKRIAAFQRARWAKIKAGQKKTA